MTCLFRLSRRLKLYRNVLLWALLVSLLPMTMLLILSYDHLITDSQESLEAKTERAHREISRLLDKAGETLAHIASAVERDDPELSNIMRHAVYESAYFREAGLIDEDGYLQLTSMGPVDPPVQIPRVRRSDPDIEGIQLKGPFQTTVMQEKSIILSLQTDGKREVNLLVNPNILIFFLDMLDNVDLGRDGFVAFAESSGKIIVADAVLPEDRRISTETGSRERLRVSHQMLDRSFMVVGEISLDFVLRHWYRQVMFAIPLTLFSVLTLFAIFLFVFRRAQALDYELKAGLKNDEFELHYQPIVDIQTGACIGSEALIRWRHPDEGVLLPNLFIPAAEKTGLIRPIGDWVVKQAVKDQSSLFDRFQLQYISINLSPIQLNSGSFEDTIKWLPTAGLSPDKFVFEITEQAMIRETQTTAQDMLKRVRKLGYSIAVDDFGTGYSSLGNLTKFDFGCLKIDRQFVAGINQDIRTNSILDAIVALGQKLGVTIIAEGVETEEQKEYLQSLGVRYAQGWLFSTPLPLEELENYIARLDSH